MEDYGLKCVYEGNKSSTIVEYVTQIQTLRCDADEDCSIIAIHGLNAHSTRTWISEASNISWLFDKNLLPRSIPNARVLTWGYNPNFSNLEPHDFSRRILQYAETLVA